jgi:hypothetical protein
LESRGAQASERGGEASERGSETAAWPRACWYSSEGGMRAEPQKKRGGARGSRRASYFTAPSKDGSILAS